MAKENNTTTVFKADITDFKASMQEAARLVRLANSEFKAATAGMDDWSSSTDGLTAKTTQLTKVLEAQKRQLDVLETEYKKVAAEQGADSRAAQELEIKVNNQKAAIANTETQLKTYEQKLEDTADATDDAGEAAEKAATGGFTVFKGILADLGATVIKEAVKGLKDLATETVKTGVAFEASMAKVAALSGATGEELEMLTDTARKYGATTQFSASEAADALGYMALAGWDAEQSASELGGVLNLAAASGMELAEASDMVTDYLSAFSNSAMTAGQFADKLAYAQANSNTSATQLGEAYRNSAANLNAAGQDVETVTALLAAMANQGLKGSKAGTALTAMMRDITKGMEEVVDEEDLAKFGIEGMTDLIGKQIIMIGDQAIAVSDAEGNFRDLTEILAEVEAATASMGAAERSAAVGSVFTADSIKGLNLVLNEGVGSTAAFEEALRDCDGAAADMAGTMTNNLSGDLKNVNSAFEEFQLNLYESVNTPLRDMAQSVSKEVLPALTDMVNGVEGSDKAFGDAVGGMIGKGVKAVVEGAPKFASAGLSIVKTLALSIVKAAPDVVRSGVTILTELLAMLGTFVPELLVGILQAVPQIVTTIAQAIPDIIRAVFGVVSSLIGALPDIIGALLAAFPEIIQALITVMMESQTALIEGVTMVIQAIADALPELLPVIVSGLQTLIEALLPALISFSPELLQAEITLFQTFVEALPIITVEIIKALPALIMAIGTAIINAAPLMLDAAVEMFTAVLDGFKQVGGLIKKWLGQAWSVFSAWAGEILKAAKEAAPKVLEAVSGFFRDLPSNLGYFLGLVIGKLFVFINDSKAKAKEAGEGFRDKLVEFFQKLPERIGSLLLEVIKKIPGFIDALKKKAKEAGESFRDNILPVLKELPGKTVEIGKNIVTGIWDGIQSMTTWIQGKVGEFSTGFLNGFKSALGIASPSKVMRDQVGKWLALGIADGFEGEIPETLREMQKGAAEIVKGLTDDLSVPLVDLGISAGSVKNVQGLSGSAAGIGTDGSHGNGAKVQNVTFNQYNSSPKALDRLSIYRDTNSMLFAAKVRLGDV